MRPLIIASLAFLAACGTDRADAFRQGVPKADAVKIDMPAQAGQALTGEGTRRDALEGDPSGMYALTRGVTLAVNGAGWLVLALVQEIVDNPPTSLSTNEAVWGPYAEPLSPNAYKLTVTRNPSGEYSYVLAGKGKNEADSAFVSLLVGTHVVTGHDLGQGSFVVDFDAAATLPEHGQQVGTAQYVYSRPTASAPVTVNAAFSKVKDATGELTDALYQYVATPGQGGTFDFQLRKQRVHGQDVNAATVRSRWQQSGAGRSDVAVSGDSAPQGATLNECWDSSFASRFFVASFAPNAGWGAESACAFSTAEYSTLSL